MSSVENSCICNKQLCITCSLIFVMEIAHLTRILTYTGAYLIGRLLYSAILVSIKDGFGDFTHEASLYAK